MLTFDYVTSPEILQIKNDVLLTFHKITAEEVVYIKRAPCGSVQRGGACGSVCRWCMSRDATVTDTPAWGWVEQTCGVGAER